EPLGLSRLGDRGRGEAGGGGLEESTAIRARVGHGRLSWAVRPQTLVILGFGGWEQRTIRPTSPPGPSGQRQANMVLSRGGGRARPIPRIRLHSLRHVGAFLP